MHHLSIPLSMGHEWFADVCIINNAATENKPYEPMCSGERRLHCGLDIQGELSRSVSHAHSEAPNTRTPVPAPPLHCGQGL